MLLGEIKRKEDNMSIYLDLFDSKDDVIREFQITESDLDNVDIIIASYSYESYDGNSFVLFEKSGELFEVIGGHCSCYGLEGQWEPQSTSKDALKRMIEEGTTPYGMTQECNAKLGAFIYG